jgi:hypothetical protein
MDWGGGRCDVAPVAQLLLEVGHVHHAVGAEHLLEDLPQPSGDLAAEEAILVVLHLGAARGG